MSRKTKRLAAERDMWRCTAERLHRTLRHRLGREHDNCTDECPYAVAFRVFDSARAAVAAPVEGEPT